MDSTTKQQRQMFGMALQAQAEQAGVKLVDLASQVGLSYEAVRRYVRGLSEPESREVVFRMEELLGVEPGALSRHLGYLPVTAQGTRPQSVLEAIAADTRLSARMKRVLTNTYAAIVGD